MSSGNNRREIEKAICFKVWREMIAKHHDPSVSLVVEEIRNKYGGDYPKLAKYSRPTAIKDRTAVLQEQAELDKRDISELVNIEVIAINQRIAFLQGLLDKWIENKTAYNRTANVNGVRTVTERETPPDERVAVSIIRQIEELAKERRKLLGLYPSTKIDMSATVTECPIPRHATREDIEDAIAELQKQLEK